MPHRLDRHVAPAADRGRLVELLVVDRPAHGVVGAGARDDLHDRLLALRGRAAQPGGDDGHAQRVADRLVDHAAVDDGRVLGGERADGVHHLVHLLQLHRVARGDVHQHPPRAGQVDVLEQRRVNGLFRRHLRALGTRGRGRAHHRHAVLAHHGAHVGEVHVHHAGAVDHLGDARDGAVQHVVRGAERVFVGHVLPEDLHEAIVGDDDEGIDVLLELLDAHRGDLLPLALEAEGLGDHRHREDAHLARDLRDHRRRARARAPAHAGGHEQHVRAGDEVLDALAVLLGRQPPDLGVGPRAQALGDARAQLQRRAREVALERLGVGVHRDELHALHAVVDHVVHRIAAAAAHAHHLDHRVRCLAFQQLDHRSSPLLWTAWYPCESFRNCP